MVDALKRIQLQEIAESTMTPKNIVKAELEEMRKEGEIMGIYVAEGCFLAYSREEENGLAETVLSQGVSLADLSRRFNLSKEEAIKLLEKIIELRKIKGVYTNDEGFYYSYQSLASKLTELLSQ